MKRIKHTFIVILALSTGFCSCTKDQEGIDPVKDQELPVQDYVMTTRVDGAGAPEHGDAYTILSYTYDLNVIRNSSSMRQYGYYAYDANGDYGVKGSLIPVTVNTSGANMYKTTLSNGKIQRNQVQGQQLVGVPLTGSNSTNQGFYRTAMIYPAIPVYNTSELGYLAVYNRTDAIYASHPDDKNGDGIPDDPFIIEVRENGNVHHVDGVKMYPVTAAIKVYLYSHYYENDETKNPEQKITFDVEEIKLVNAGRNGWFNPATGVVYPNYNYDALNPALYSSTVSTTNGNNAENLSINPSVTTILTSYTGIQTTAQYETGDVSVFPTDYRGVEGGGSPYIIPMTLSLKLKDSNGLYNNASVPIALMIEKNKRYTFYVNIKSKQIEIAYAISDWVPAGENYTDIGSDVEPYLTIGINRYNGGWSTNDNGSSEIGN